MTLNVVADIKNAKCKLFSEKEGETLLMLLSLSLKTTEVP